MFDYGETHVICDPLVRPQFYCFKRVEVNASSSILTSMSHNRKLLTYSWNLIKVNYVFASCIRTFQVRFVCGMHFILSNEKAIWKYHFPTRKTKTAFHVKKNSIEMEWSKSTSILWMLFRIYRSHAHDNISLNGER